MRFVFTSDLAGLGGGEVGILYLAEHLKAKHECLLIIKEDGPFVDELKRRDLFTRVVNYKNRGTLFARLKEVHSIMADFQPDAVFSNDPVTSILMNIALLGVNSKNYWMAHGQWYQFSQAKKFFLKRSVDGVFCVSDVVKNSLDEQGFSNCVVSYLGVPKSTFLKGGFALPQNLDVVKIMTIARFQKIKGQLKGVDAVSRLIAEGFKVQYYLVGGSIFGNPEDDVYEKTVRKKVSDLSLEGNIHFLGERRDIPELMREADCLLIPSDNESLGLVALEAVMSNLPIASTPNDGVKEILEGNPLCVSSTNDALGLYQVLKRQLTMTDDERFELSCFYERLQDKYSIASVAETILRRVRSDLKLSKRAL